MSILWRAAATAALMASGAVGVTAEAFYGGADTLAEVQAIALGD